MHVRRVLFIVVVFTLQVKDICGDEWNRFRGPNGSGVLHKAAIPEAFGPDENVRWRVKTPPGHSSPVLGTDLLFVTAVENAKLWTIAIARGSGKELWRRETTRTRSEKLDSRNSAASPSPVTDGSNVWVFFPDFGIVAYDHTGRERWKVPLGPFNNVYGMGASPILTETSVVLVCDQSLESYIIALDKDTGDVRWKQSRPEARSGHSTPILLEKSPGHHEILVPGSFLLTAYDANSGNKAWWVRGLSFEMKSTPVISDTRLFINGYGSPANQPENIKPIEQFNDVLARDDSDGDSELTLKELSDKQARGYFQFLDLDMNGKLVSVEWNYYRAAMASKNSMMAVKLGGKGDMTETNVEWQYHRAVPQLPSPLVYEGVLYMVSDTGIVTSFQTTSGDVIAQGRLRGVPGPFYASPVAADGKIFMINREGRIAVLHPGGQLMVQQVNDLKSQCLATPALTRDRIYIRTADSIYAFGF